MGGLRRVWTHSSSPAAMGRQGDVNQGAVPQAEQEPCAGRKLGTRQPAPSCQVLLGASFTRGLEAPRSL